MWNWNVLSAEWQQSIQKKSHVRFSFLYLRVVVCFACVCVSEWVSGCEWVCLVFPLQDRCMHIFIIYKCVNNQRQHRKDIHRIHFSENMMHFSSKFGSDFNGNWSLLCNLRRKCIRSVIKFNGHPFNSVHDRIFCIIWNKVCSRQLCWFKGCSSLLPGSVVNYTLSYLWLYKLSIMIYWRLHLFLSLFHFSYLCYFSFVIISYKFLI